MRIEDHPFFESLRDEEVARLRSAAKILRFLPGEVIFEEGSSPLLLYLVLDGTVEFLKQVGPSTFHPVSTSQPGEFFGEIGVFTGDPRALRAQAQSQVVLATLTKQQLEEFIVEASGPMALTLRSIVHHLHQTTKQFMEDVLHQEKMAVVGNMVNSLIHDFKNPFSCIRLAAGFLNRRHEDPKTKELCTQIDKQIERMLDMAEEVSLYSRGAYQPSFAPIRLPALIDRFRELNFPFFENESVSVSIEVEDVEFEGEENKLLRVLQNLVGNAIDACSDSGRVRIAGKGRGDSLELSVSDNAGGIPEEIRDHLFDPFVTHGKRKGTGLGTAIAKTIVEAHGGTIDFETKTGEGTVFRIRIPKRRPSQATTASPRKEAVTVGSGAE